MGIINVFLQTIFFCHSSLSGIFFMERLPTSGSDDYRNIGSIVSVFQMRLTSKTVL